MEKFGWGKVEVKLNKRGRDSVLFHIKEDILSDSDCVRKLINHGVSTSELKDALTKENSYADTDVIIYIYIYVVYTNFHILLR